MDPLRSSLEIATFPAFHRPVSFMGALNAAVKRQLAAISCAKPPGQPRAVAALQRRKLALKLARVAWVDPAHMSQQACLYDFLNLAMRNDSISTCSGVFMEVGLVRKVNLGQDEAYHYFDCDRC